MDSNAKKELISWLIALAVAIFVGVGFREYCMEIYSVDGVSMLPTLSDNDKLIVEKISANTGDFKRGDILVFHYPSQHERYFVKRIIGLPGDTVEITHGRVFVLQFLIVDKIQKRKYSRIGEYFLFCYCNSL